jgi:hypothetical protein
VLADPSKDLDLAGAPGLLWDARVHAHRAPASTYPALRRWLLQTDRAFEDIPAPSSPTHGLWSDVDLGPYQEAALSAWELGHRGSSGTGAVLSLSRLGAARLGWRSQRCKGRD